MTPSSDLPVGGPSETWPEGERRYPARPVVGVGAVILTDAGEVVLVKRLREPLAGQWSLPGGAVELGETLRAAVAREVREETGLVVDVGPLVELLDRVFRDDDGRVRYHFVLADFLCHPRGGALAAASDAGQVVLAKLDDLNRFGLAAETKAVIQRGQEGRF